jgi:hypothetical protein
MLPAPASPGDEAFAARLIRRKDLFLGLSIAGVTIAAALSAYYGWRRWHDPQFQVGARAVIVLLVLLNARQNLRQYRCARIVARLTGGGGP